MKNREHAYRLGQTGRRFSFQSGKGLFYLGRFEFISHPDACPEGRWTFDYDRFAQQDDTANAWVYDQLLRMNG